MNPTHSHTFSQTSNTSCPQCGNSLALPSSSSISDDAHRRIRDLEAQVKLLNSKAAAAVDKLADYEDENRFLRAANARSQQQLGGPPQEGQTQQQQTTRLASLGNLLRRRNPSGDAAAQLSPPSTAISPSEQQQILVPPLRPDTSPAGPQNYSTPLLPTIHASSSSQSSPLTLNSLHAALETERQLRLRAETSLTQSQTDLFQTQSELEELTAQLFGQANEMVATERRERAKLEDRVKVLEIREREKKGRLDKLEERIKRVERVRVLVG